MERLHILDGHGYIFRAYFGLMSGGPAGRGVRLSTSEGMPTGALYVFTQMLLRLYADVHPERIVVVFDAPGPSFRRELDEKYKATRKETPEDLRPQLPHFRPLTEALSWPVVSIPGVEADDVIATMTEAARERGWEVTIYSGDKDLMQLVDDQVKVVDAMRQITYDHDRVVEKFGVPPALVADWLALVGDTSDNIPGVAGVGKVTAAKLLNEYGSIDKLLAHTAELKGKLKERLTDPEQLERLALSRKLVALRRDVELGVALDDLRPASWDGAPLRALLEKFEFHNLITRLESITGPVPSLPAAAANGAVAQPAAPAESGASTPSTPTIDANAVETVIALDEAPLVDLVARAREAGSWSLAIHADELRADRQHVIGMSMWAPGGPAVYWPIEHRYLAAPAQLAVGRGREILRPIIEGERSSRPKLRCHDGKRAAKALASLGLALRHWESDTMLASFLLDSSVSAYDLPRIAASAAKVSIEPLSSVVGKGKGMGFESVAVERAAAWAGPGVAATHVAAEALDAEIEAQGFVALYREVELPLASLLAELELRGICLDTEFLRTLSDEVSARVAEIERTVYDLAGGDINIGSPKQLSALLFDRLGLRSERMKKTKTGYSTDHEVLESLIEAHPIIAPILEHRELVKLKGTYLDALPPLVNPETGRLHTTFLQGIAETGRLSSVDPNLQNIPIRTELGREIRRAFVPAEGKVLLSADYSQIELRVLAHLSGDPVLTAAFFRGGDVHTQTAAEVFGIPVEEVGAHERRVAKAVNYGLVYGQSEFGLARSLGISRHEARHYIETYFDRFATVRTYMDSVVEEARKEGAAVTILGRRRPIPEISHKNHMRRKAAERVAQNTPMQGSAADIMKVAMLRVDEAMRSADLDAAMLLTVHDELVFEVAPGDVEDLKTLVTTHMSQAIELKVPLEVTVGVGPNWSDAH